MKRALGSRTSIALVIIAALLLTTPLAAWADQVKLNVGLANPVLLSGKKQTTYLKVGLTGFPMASAEKRAPVNVAIVLDKSGSMAGQKIEQAKSAAIQAINRLQNDDIVSIVAYDHTVQVVLPATKVTDKYAIASAIRRITAGGNTALFGGVCKGAEEVRKFLDRNRVNRIILLSDGLANVGPSSPAELGALGASLVKEGISVTTLGIGTGYNEDLMYQLAKASDANHTFIGEDADIAQILNREFGDILSVVAKEVLIKVTCAAGIRPVRALGRDADISGSTVTAVLSQLYSRQEKYILIEVEVPATAAETSRPVAEVTVSYANMQTMATDHLSSTVSTRFSPSEQIVGQETRPDVMIAVAEQIATENSVLAVTLRDQGKVEEARRLLEKNVAYLGKYATKYKSDSLRSLQKANWQDSQNLEGKKWIEGRKLMRDIQSERQQQRGYTNPKR